VHANDMQMLWGKTFPGFTRISHGLCFFA